MKKVERGELLGLSEYEQIRGAFRARVIAEKADRRLLAGDEVSVIFENHDTVLLQIQEMLRTERITKEAAIAHEIETYNELIPDENELSITMFVEIPDAEVRERRLVELAGLEARIALEVLGTTVRGHNETRGVLPDRTTAVHYVKFALGTDLARRFLARALDDPRLAAYFVLDHPKLSVRKELPPAMVKSIAEDLAG
jgi:hypothetical protein